MRRLLCLDGPRLKTVDKYSGQNRLRKSGPQPILSTRNNKSSLSTWLEQKNKTPDVNHRDRQGQTRRTQEAATV